LILLTYFLRVTPRSFRPVQENEIWGKFWRIVEDGLFTGQMPFLSPKQWRLSIRGCCH